MVTRDMALSRSLIRLAAIEDELKTHMASMEHESQLIAQCVGALSHSTQSVLTASNLLQLE